MKDIDLASVVQGVLQAAKSNRRLPSRQDVADTVEVELVGQEVTDNVRDDLIYMAWILTMRMWWLKKCVPEFASVGRWGTKWKDVRKIGPPS